MAYIGNTLRTAQPNYQIIDDISASFDGSTTTFALQVGGVTPAPFPVSAQHCLISVGGVVQQPDPTGTDGFLLSGSNIVFSAAPSAGENFFGVVLAGADYINVGAEFPDGSVANPSITFDSDRDTGLYRKGANNITITTNGTERVSVGTSEVVFNDGGNDINFRIEGDTESNLFFVDAGNDRIGIGTTAAQHSLSLKQGNALGWVSGAGNAKQKIEATGSDGLDFYTGSTPTLKATLDSSGRLLVGTSSTSRTARAVFSGNSSDNGETYVYLNRGTAATSSGSAIGFLDFSNGDADSCASIYCYTDNACASGDSPGRLVFATTADGANSPTERLRLTSAGLFQSLPIWNTTGGDAANVVVNSNGTLFRSTSSAKYKTDIESLQDQYADAILELRPVWYRSTCKIDNPDWSYWGFIAEEVAEIDPRLVSWKTTEVSYDENGSAIETPCDPEPEGVAYDRFVPHLLNLVKRQQAAIKALEAEKTAQQTQLDDLIARVTALETN